MCAARAKCQAVAAAPAPIVAAVSERAPAPSKHHPRGIILEVVGTASPDHEHSCKEHACCSCKVLQDDVVVRLQREQILVPDHIAGKGTMKEEKAITVNWVLDGVDCCSIGFLPRAHVMQGELWDGILCQVVDVFEKNDPSQLQREKWHHNKGYARVAVISYVPFGPGILPQKKDKDMGAKGGGKKGN
jgi:hypothetical protein